MDKEKYEKKIAELENRIRQLESHFISGFKDEKQLKNKLKLPQLKFLKNDTAGHNVFWDTTDPAQEVVEVLEIPYVWCEVTFDPPAPVPHRLLIPLWRANYNEFQP